MEKRNTSYNILLDNNKELLEEKSEILHLLIGEYSRITNNIHSIDTTFLSLQNIPMMGLFVAFGLFEKFTYLALLLPFFALYFAYNIAKYTLVIFEYSGYASFLEERINSYFPEKVLLQESIFRDRLRNNHFVGGFLQLAIALPVYFSTYYFFIIEAIRIYEGNCINKIVITGLSISLLIASIALVYCVIVLRNAKEESKNALIKFWEKEMNI